MSLPIVITTLAPASISGFSPSKSGSAQPSSDTTAGVGSWDVATTIEGPLTNTFQVTTAADRYEAIALLVNRLGA